MKKIFITTACLSLLLFKLSYADYPKSPEDKRAEDFGSVLQLTGKKDKEPVFKLGVLDKKAIKERKKRGRGGKKTCIWKAAVKFLEAKPILISDSRSGLLSTDWFEEQNVQNQRKKINIVVSGRGKSLATTVTVFKQTMTAGIWRDAGTDAQESARIVEQLGKAADNEGCANEDKE